VHDCFVDKDGVPVATLLRLDLSSAVTLWNHLCHPALILPKVLLPAGLSPTAQLPDGRGCLRHSLAVDMNGKGDIVINLKFHRVHC